MRQALAINLVVADLLCICVFHSRKFFLNNSVFNHPGQENCMADDASHLFHLSDTTFLTHMSVIHPQLQGLWKISLPPPELIYCMILTLRRKLCKPSLLRMRDKRCCTGSSPTSVSPCQSILLSKIHPFLASKSSNSMTTVSGTPSNPSARGTNLGNNRFHRHGGQL